MIVPAPRGTLPDVIPEPSSDPTTEPATGAAVAAEAGAGAAAPADDEAVLDQLEADLTAVEHAISTLDRVTAEGEGGESAANQIAVAVSAERFGVGPADAVTSSGTSSGTPSA